MTHTEKLLKKIENLMDGVMDSKSTVKIMRLIGVKLNERELSEYVLWGDCLPIADEYPYTEKQRNLHILWEVIDRVPLCLNVAFAIPFRRLIAKRLFARCGDGFIANEGCRFNYGHRISVGNNVTWNHCCYIDSKGRVSFGDFSMITEYTKIFSHGHSESNHMERSYSSVSIGDYAKIYTACTILPGVTVGTGGIAATGSIVTKDIPPYTVVAGIPAKIMRERKSPKDVSNLNHYTLKDKLFQK